MRRRITSAALIAFIPTAGAFLQGCTKDKLFNLPMALKPMPWIFKQMPDNLSVQDQAAWRHGCESGLATQSNAYYRSNYRYIMDPALRQDPDYYKLWKDSYDYCRFYVFTRLRESNLRYRLPNTAGAVLAVFTPQSFISTSGAGGAGLFQFGGTNGWDGTLLENFGYIAGNSSFIGADGANGTWDFSDGYTPATTGLYDALNWDLRPTWGFVW